MGSYVFTPMLLALGFAAVVAWLLRSKKPHVKLFSLVSSVVSSAHQLGATGTPPMTRRGSMALSLGGRDFVLNCSDFTKRGAMSIWLGTHIAPAGPSPSKGYRSAAGPAPLAALPRVLLRKETERDRIGKRLGLNHELQTGDREFDELVYVEGDAGRGDLVRLFADDAVRTAVRGLLQAGVSAVALDAEGHAAAVKWSEVDADPVSAETLAAVADRLAAFVAALPPMTSTSPRPRRVWLDVLIPALWALAGVFVLAALALGTTRWQPVSATFHRLGLAVSTVAALLVVGLVWLKSRGRPRGLARFVAGTAIAIALAPGTAVTALLGANAALDDGVAVVETEVVARRVAQHRRSQSYHLQLAPWPGMEQPRELELSQVAFNRVQLARRVRLDLGAGALGIPWLRHIDPAE